MPKEGHWSFLQGCFSLWSSHSSTIPSLLSCENLFYIKIMQSNGEQKKNTGFSIGTVPAGVEENLTRKQTIKKGGESYRVDDSNLLHIYILQPCHGCT